MNVCSLWSCHVLMQFFHTCHSNQTTWRLKKLQNSDLLQIIKADLSCDGVKGSGSQEFIVSDKA